METTPAAEQRSAALRALLSQHDVLSLLLTQLDPVSLACAACACADMCAASKPAWVAVRARHWPHTAVPYQFPRRRGAKLPQPPPAHKVCAAYGAAAAEAGAQPRPVPPLSLKNLHFSVCISRADGDRAVVYAGTMRGTKFGKDDADAAQAFDADAPLARAWSVPWDTVCDTALVASLFVERRRACAGASPTDQKNATVDEVACLFSGRAGQLREYEDSADDEYDSADEQYDDGMERIHSFLFPFYDAADMRVHRYGVPGGRSQRGAIQLLPVAAGGDDLTWYGRINLKLRLTFVPPEAQPAATRADDDDDDDEYEAFERAARVPCTPCMRASLSFMQEPDRERRCRRCDFSDDDGEPRAQHMLRDDLACALDSLSWHAM